MQAHKRRAELSASSEGGVSRCFVHHATHWPVHDPRAQCYTVMATSTSANVGTTPSPRDIDSACTDARRLAFESLQPVWDSYVTRVSDALTVATHRHEHGQSSPAMHTLHTNHLLLGSFARESKSQIVSRTCWQTARSKSGTSHIHWFDVPRVSDQCAWLSQDLI